MASNSKQLACADYHVAWVCPRVDVELLPARLMLDEEHSTPPYDTHYDENTYICGAINGHTVVVATCPQAETGNVNAGRLTAFMFKTFPNIRMAILVGIGGGIPRSAPSEDSLEDIHLGDVVVGWPGDGKPACVYADRGRSMVGGQFELVGTMQNPDWRLLQALGILASDYEIGKTTFANHLRRLQKHKKSAKKFAHPGLDHDRLFKASYPHIENHESNCLACDPKELVQRPQRSADDTHEFVFHRGRIASVNADILDGEQRDQIREKCDGALCVEMEAAGVDANRRCLVIRGISDYADSHKNDVWRSHAAGNAAVFARELLCRIQPAVVRDMKGRTEAPWIVPFVRPSFVGRENQLAQLDAHISSEGGRRLAIYGLGGCGKTAIALESVYRTRDQQPTRAIFWVPALSQESFEQAFRDIGTHLRIPGIVDDNADAKQLVKAWLSDEDFGPWLMVVDNADDVSVLLDPLEAGRGRLINFLPHSRRGSIVFTTRTRKAAIDLASSNAIRLEELAEEEAEKVLRTRLLPDHQHLLEDNQVLHEFLNMLTLLALAIVQAAAFINKNNCTLIDYISVYRDNEKGAIKLLGKDFEDQGRYQDTNNPLATTWYISFMQIQKQNPLAADYLAFMACVAGEKVPRSLLFSGSDGSAMIEAVGILDAYAFVTERKRQQGKVEEQYKERMYDMHPLVRLAMQNWLRAHQRWGAWVEKTMTRLMKVIPYGGHKGIKVWTAYLPHAMHVVELSEVHETEEKLQLLDRLGNCEQSLGLHSSAELTHRKALEQRRRLLGKEHRDTLSSMDRVARALRDQEKYAEAEKMHWEVLAVCKKVLGEEHPETMWSMNFVAESLNNQGKYVEAEKMHRESLALSKKVLGEEHPTTLGSMNFVAELLKSQGKYAEAEKMHREILALSKKVLGEEHTATLGSMNIVAELLTNQGKYTEAENMHRESLALSKKTLGEQHPTTLGSMNFVANSLNIQGKYVEAEKMHRESLALSKKVLGEEHPNTLGSMNFVANSLNIQGKHAEAEKMHLETLALRKKVLGEEHPATLRSMNIVAKSLNNQGKYAEAEKTYREKLALSKKALGEEHTATLESMNIVAELLNNQGKYVEAEKMHRESLALSKKVLGEEHPTTLGSMNFVAKSLNNQGKHAEAEKICRETLAIHKNVLGEEHPTTLGSMELVAELLNNQGKYAEAENMHRESLALSKKALGEEHPATLGSMKFLAKSLNIQGEHAEAEKMHRETLAIHKNVLGEEHLETLSSMTFVAESLSRQGKYEEAKRMYRDVLAISEKLSGKWFTNLLTSSRSMVTALNDQGKCMEGDRLALCQKTSRKEHPDVATLSEEDDLSSYCTKRLRKTSEDLENISRDAGAPQDGAR